MKVLQQVDEKLISWDFHLACGEVDPALLIEPSFSKIALSLCFLVAFGGHSWPATPTRPNLWFGRIQGHEWPKRLLAKNLCLRSTK